MTDITVKDIYYHINQFMAMHTRVDGERIHINICYKSLAEYLYENLHRTGKWGKVRGDTKA